MNRFFAISNILDGDYDWETKELKFDLKRCIWNYLVAFASFHTFLNHVIIFLTNDDYLKHNLVSFRLFEGKGERIFNMVAGAASLCMGSIILVYKEFHKDQSTLNAMRFLFCLDEKKMEKEFHLNHQLAKQQVKYQRNFLRFSRIWHWLYVISMLTFIPELAIDNLEERKFGFFFLLQGLLYLFLFIEFLTGIDRCYIVFGQKNLTCIYFSSYLQTLIYKMQKLADQKGSVVFDKKLMKINRRYDQLIKQQNVLNRHFGRVFYFYFNFISFTFIYSMNILFIDLNETLRIAFELTDYFNLVLFIFCPVIISNTFFTRTNSKFTKKCFNDASPYLCRVKSKIKMLNIYTLNSSAHSISFNFKQFVNYSSYFFVFWCLESVSLVLLFYASYKVR